MTEIKITYLLCVNKNMHILANAAKQNLKNQIKSEEFQNSEGIGKQN